MDLPLNAEVHCSDGRCGRSTHIIINPATDKVTHLVVKGRAPGRVERLVPVNWVANTAAEVILLDRSIEEFSQLEPFTRTDFIRAEIPQYPTEPRLTLLWPYVVPTRQIIVEKSKQISPGKQAIRRGARVRAADGRVGRVDEFVVDPEDGQITHLVMREGHLWGQRDVCIPLEQVHRIEENTVYLDIDKEAVEALPAVPVRRWW